MTVMARLKSETRPQHEQLEQHPLSQALMAVPPRLDAISTLLQKFYGFYVPVEARLMQQPGFDFAARSKVRALEFDLAILGIKAAALPLCPTLPPINTLADALGCAYVLEGATLGGQIINRHLSRHLDQRFAFYSSYGEEVGIMWKAFGAFANSYATTPQLEDQVVAAACATFTTLENWLHI